MKTAGNTVNEIDPLRSKLGFVELQNALGWSTSPGNAPRTGRESRTPDVVRSIVKVCPGP